MLGTLLMGTLPTVPALTRPDLLAEPVVSALEAWPATADVAVDEIHVAPIDPHLTDTAAFCAAYQVGLHRSANCVVVTGKGDGAARHAACVVLATTRADVNGVVRRRLDVREARCAPMAEAAALTGMEYGGITPVGLPGDWPILVDSRVVACRYVVVGSGLRHSKLVLPGRLLAAMPNVEVVKDLARPVA